MSQAQESCLQLKSQTLQQVQWIRGAPARLHVFSPSVVFQPACGNLGNLPFPSVLGMGPWALNTPSTDSTK